ncbi:MAG: metal ABC transporter substrate-binding protein [Planctomycetota bacterium]|nr:metal ABC transporter substrate-binding protein [Planctomycetota bacterium]
MRATLLPLPLALAALVACSSGTDEPRGPDTLDAVYTTFHPLAYAAERIAGGAVEVVCLLPAGADPAHWRPEREALARYQAARLVLRNGAGYERWIETVSLPHSRNVDTSQGLEAGLWIEQEVTTHSHGLTGEHSHGAVDAMIWINPTLFSHQAGEAHKAMRAAWPQHAEAFDRGIAALRADLEALAEELEEVVRDQRLVAAGEGFAYLDRRQLAVDIEGFNLSVEEPGGAGLNRLEQALQERPAQVILWPVAPPADLAKTFQDQYGLTSVRFDLATSPLDGDYLSIQRDNIARLRAALE